MIINSKKLFKVLWGILAVCMIAVLASCNGMQQTASIRVNFEGNAEGITIKEGAELTVPEYEGTVEESQVFLGWGKEAGKAEESAVLYHVGDKVAYANLKEQAGTVTTLKLYPVIGVKKSITVTFKAETDVTHTLYEGSTTTVSAPAMSESAKMFMGWSVVEGGEVTVQKDTIFNYSAVAALTEESNITLYPVYKEYDLIVGIVNVKFEKEDEEGNVIKSVESYIEDMKAAFAAIKPEANVLFRVYDGSVAECGAAIVADADVHVVLAGNNIDSTGGVTLIAKAKLAAAYNADGSRRGGLIINTPLAIEMYAMVIGSENKEIEVTVKADSASEGKVTVVNSALGNAAEILVSEGRVIVGYSRTEGAETPEIAGEVLDYAAVEALATEGKVTLYPVYGAYDAVIAIWAVNGKNTYATEEEVAALEALIREKLTPEGQELILRIDMVSGGKDVYSANIASDVTVVLSGKNVVTQCGTTGAWEVTHLEFSSTRYVGVYPDRIKTEKLDFVAALVKLLAEQTVTLNVYETVESATPLTTTLSYVEGNEFDESKVIVPNGKMLTGWALKSAPATVVISASLPINYDNAVKYAVEGVVELVPVFEAAVTYDLIIAVWAVNNDNIYATDEEIAALEAFIKTTLGSEINVRIDKVEGGTSAYPKNIAEDVMMVISGKNVVTQCGTIGAHKVTALEFSSTRYASYFESRVSAEQLAMINSLIAALAPAA